MATIYRLPSGGQGYGGAQFWVRPGRDGCIYVVYCGIRPKTPANPEFGPQAFRIHPDGRREWLNLEKPPREGIRPSVIEYPNRAEVAWFGEGETFIDAVPLPGYVPADFDGTVPDPIPVAPVNPTPVPHECVDEEGRRYTNDVKNRLMGEVSRLDKRIDAVQASGGGISRHEAWQLARDSVYSEIVNREGGIASEIEKIAQRVVDASTGKIDREQLKALVREVILELINN